MARPDDADSEMKELGRPSYSKEMKNIVKLAQYIKERYLNPQSDNYCDFKGYSDVLENILEKYENLSENLDDFLFEF